MSKKILVVGSLNMDLVVRAQRHPQVGETILGSQFQTFSGGKGANQAVAAVRLGATVQMIGKVGGDAFGDILLSNVSSDGVDTNYISRDARAATGVALITVSEDGQNTIVVASGANSSLTPQDIRAAEPAFRGAGALVMQLEIPLPAVSAAMELARKHNVPIILNPAPAQALPAEILAGVDYLLPNQTELAILSDNAPTMEEALQRMQAKNVRCLIVTLGDAGSLVIKNGQRSMQPAYQVHSIDSVGAGDAFIGAFAVALNEGRSLEDAVRWGNAAGAITVTRRGAQPSLPTRQELEKFLAENPS